MARISEHIRLAAALTADEEEQLFRWSADPFGVLTLGLTWRPKDVHVVLDVEGRPVSHVGLLGHDVRVGGVPIRVTGVGGVITRPEAQGQGYARRLLAEALQYAAETWRPDVALLFCRPGLASFYEALGWSIVSAPVTIAQPDRQVASPVPVMIRPLACDTWPAGPVDLESLPW